MGKNKKYSIHRSHSQSRKLVKKFKIKTNPGILV